jgi:catechol 2,3-dioxygenase
MSYLIRQMGHVTLGVPDPLASAADLRDLTGLQVTRPGDDEVRLSSNARSYEMVLQRAPVACVRAIGLEAVSAAAVEEVGRRVASDGLELLADAPMHGGGGRAVRFRGPGGAIFEVHTPVARRPLDQLTPAGVRPRRIEHVNILVEDVRAARDFLTTTLALKLSDTAGEDMLSWYRAEDGFHHTVALGPGPNKLHHYAFDLHALADLAGIADRLAQRQRALLWGPGRHAAGGNVFTYYVDPDGCLVENSIEMTRIDVDSLHQPTHWPIGEGMSGRWINLWGGGPPVGFGDPGLAFARDV